MHNSSSYRSIDVLSISKDHHYYKADNNCAYLSRPIAGVEIIIF